MVDNEPTIAGTCVAFPLLEVEGRPAAILLRGPSGAGKSDLALRLIDDGARLLADDQVVVRQTGDVLTVRAPAAIEGLLEVRGVGPVVLPAEAEGCLIAVIDLVENEAVERLPEPESVELENTELPLWRLDPFAASSVAKIGVMVAVATGTAEIKT